MFWAIKRNAAVFTAAFLFGNVERHTSEAAAT